MKLASEAQFRFIKRLVGERELSAEMLTAVEVAREFAIAGTLTSQAASALISGLLAEPKRSQAPAAASIEAPKGMHKVGEEIYKIQKSRESGRTYAKQLVQNGGKWEFVYAPGAVYRLTAETVMSAEEAAKFGHLFGVCVNCAAELSDEVSIHFGYGPVCAKNHGWPYGKRAMALQSSEGR